MMDLLAKRNNRHLSVVDTQNASSSESQSVSKEVLDHVVGPKEGTSDLFGVDNLFGLPAAHLKSWSMKPRQRRQALAICLLP